MARERKHGNVSSKMVLSGPEEEGTYNRFSCFAVHSKMSQSTNAKSKPTEGLYTDTDPDDRSEIITDMTIRMPGKAGTMMMEVKVDPGAHFRDTNNWLMAKRRSFQETVREVSNKPIHLRS